MESLGYADESAEGGEWALAGESPDAAEEAGAFEDSDPWNDPDAEPAGAEGESLSELEIPAPPSATQLADISAEQFAEGVLIQLEADGSIWAVESFALENPDRLVIDLPGLTAPGVSKSFDVGTGRVARIRVGTHGDKVRVVIDGGADSNGFVDRSMKPSADGLVVAVGSGEALEMAMGGALSAAEEAWTTKALEAGLAVAPAIEEKAEGLIVSDASDSSTDDTLESTEEIADEGVDEIESPAVEEVVTSQTVEIYGLQYESQEEIDRIAILSEGVIDYVVLTPDSETVVVSLLNSVISDQAAGRIMAAEGAPISLITAFQQPEVEGHEVRVVVKRAPDVAPEVTRRGSLIFIDFPHSGVAAADWNPLGQPMESLKSALDEHGIYYELDLAFIYQSANKVLTGERHFGTFAWRLLGDWEMIDSERFGQSYLEWNFLGAAGFNYDPAQQTLSENIGSVSYPNGIVYPDAGAINELFLSQVSPSGRFELFAGRIDMYYHFDLNRVSNDSYTGFLSYALGSNLSIPFPEYGGLGAVAYAQVTEGLSVMLGVGDSSSEWPVAFWETVGDGSWWQLLEVEWQVDVPGLGVGIYRLTPWHNHLFGEDGWGIGLNVDQELGVPWIIAFLRAGRGDPDVAFVETFVSGGVGIKVPLGRSGDEIEIGIGAAWSDPSPEYGFRAETLLEFFCRISLSPSIAVTPDLQVVFNPAANPRDDVVVIPGVRLAFRF